MNSYLHVLVVLAINAKKLKLISQYRMWHDQIIAKHYMDIINKNELQTHQAMDSRHMQKVNCTDKKV